MIAVPAVDLRGGHCVQLVGGSYADERVRVPDPVAVARDWGNRGFERLHVVDLDAATGAGNNAAIVDAIIATRGSGVQVGGGVRDYDRVESLLTAGADRVVLGTRALQEWDWLEGIAYSHPGHIVVAADVRGGKVAVNGWSDTLDATAPDIVRELGVLPLAAVLVTAVDVEGRMSGPDLRLIESVIEVSTLPVIASGGIGSLRDLRALADRGVAEVVIGMALYTGAIDLNILAREYGA
jgi:phosphoribosylformimino-5-aminoimidazole carboxamide ribotide isomerase